MTVKTIITEPNNILRQVSKPVEKVGNEEQQLMRDMLETMYAANGIGLAAIQIGVPKRIIVMDISHDDKKKEPRYFVNPVILKKNSKTTTYEEGCLSFPEHFAEIDRPDKLKIEYIDENNKKKILSTDGFNSRIIQHELDHLNGILFVDHLSRLKRDVIIRKMKKFKKEEKIV